MGPVTCDDDTVASWERRFPDVRWDEPIAVRASGETTVHYGCRICIAKLGMPAEMVGLLPRAPEHIERHIAERHAGGCR
jgi:hypothetical protein